MRFSWLRKPVIHFLLIGGTLFWLQSAWLKHFQPPVVEEPQDLVISKTQIEQLKNDAFVQTGSRATTEELERLIQMAIDEEVLYREAIALKLDQNNLSIRLRLIDLAKVAEDSKNISDDLLFKKALDLGFDRTDPVIRRLLISTMGLVAKKIPTRTAPAKVEPEALEAHLAAHADQYQKPIELKFRHLYFSRDKRKTKAKTDAEFILKKLSVPGAKPEDLPDNGDPFLGGSHFSYMNPTAIERQFGRAFSPGLDKLAVGTWSGPIPSSYGWHLIYVEDIHPARPATLPEVSNQIKSAILKEREAQRLNETIQKLRLKYKIIIEREEKPHA